MPAKPQKDETLREAHAAPAPAARPVKDAPKFADPQRDFDMDAAAARVRARFPKILDHLAKN